MAVNIQYKAKISAKWILDKDEYNIETNSISSVLIEHDYDNNKNYNKKSIIPRRAINWIRQNIKTLENTSRQHKEIKRAMGDNNAFQKSGGTRNNGGKAHTQKTSNGGTIRYF